MAREAETERTLQLFNRFPLMKVAHDLVHHLQMFLKRKCNKEIARREPESWCRDVIASRVDKFVVIVQSIQLREDEVFNYFVNR